MKQSTGFFGNIELNKKIISAIEQMGFEEPSPIQSQTIPLVLEGKDVIGQAQTGTGKTAAFGIPVIDKISEIRNIQALIITPTRELCIQVAEELAKIGKYKKVRTLPVYGGQAIERQIRGLASGVHIIIGTPGRLLDHLSRGTIKLDHVKYLILDEADEMLDMGFIDDVQEIIRAIPAHRQTLLFSATMPKQVLDLAKNYMCAPTVVSISKEQLTVPLIDQVYYESRDKLEGLCRVLDLENSGKTIIFCRTKKGVDELTATLSGRGYLAGGLHGDLTQAQRDKVMKMFRDGQIEILIATDVAARGLDIDNLMLVINFDIPQDPESYVHRIGRTGRAGKKGIAITFITPREYRQLKLIEKTIKTRIIRREVPTTADIIERQRETIKSRLIAMLEQNNTGSSVYHSIIADLNNDYEAVDIAAAALKLYQEGFKENKKLEEETVFANTGAQKGMVRLFMNIGRSQKIRPEDIVRTIAQEADIPGRIIGLINIYDKFTFVEVPDDVAERVLSVMHKNTINGYRVNVEPAKSRQ